MHTRCGGICIEIGGVGVAHRIAPLADHRLIYRVAPEVGIADRLTDELLHLGFEFLFLFFCQRHS
jgi:hypothetical protein